MKKIVNIMTTLEAIKDFIEDKDLVKEYRDIESYKNMDLSDEISVQNFLDNDAGDIERLTREQCEFFNLEYEEGYYICTFEDEYLMVE